MITPFMFRKGHFDELLFTPNEHTVQYYQIVINAINEKRIKTSPNDDNHIYYESHHIVPRSLGGNNSKTNRVLLTAKEHFLCHTLLPEMVIGINRSKMCKALFRMIHGNQEQRKEPINNELYSTLRQEISHNMSLKFKDQPIPEERKRRISESKKGKMTDEHKQILSATHKGKIPWNKGKVNEISDETREKIRNSKLGKKRGPLSEETRKKMSDSHKGRLPWNANKRGYKRKPHSDETKQKIKESWAKRRLAQDINDPASLAEASSHDDLSTS